MRRVSPSWSCSAGWLLETKSRCDLLWPVAILVCVFAELGGLFCWVPIPVAKVSSTSKSQCDLHVFPLSDPDRKG